MFNQLNAYLDIKIRIVGALCAVLSASRLLINLKRDAEKALYQMYLLPLMCMGWVQD
jgi:hypothetical protein